MTEQLEPVVERRPFEELVLIRLDEIERRIERVLSLVCPVCGPAVTREIHPDWHADATFALVSTNGEHGR